MPVRLRERSWIALRRARNALGGPRVIRETRWLVSEGGWKLHTRVHHAKGQLGRAPAVLLVPGLGAPGAVFEGWGQPLHVDELVAAGCVVMTVDLSGRGKSWGNEVYGGPEHQADVRSCLNHLAERGDVDPNRLGIISFSLGCAATAAALCHGRRPAVAWWIDWEGPSDREIITSGGRMMDPALGHRLDDDAYWQPREATRWVGRTGVPYLRYQSKADHAQPGEFRHATRMIRAAAAGDLPWFQLNDHPRREVPEHPQWCEPGLRPAHAWILRQVCLLHCLP